jgi:hypothetical protein
LYCRDTFQRRLAEGQFRFAAQDGYAILTEKSAFPDEREKKLPLRSEMNGKNSTTPAERSK